MISSSLAFSLLFFLVYSFFEPQLASAVGSSTTVTQTVTSEVTISTPGPVTMSGSIPGITGGTATGAATWTVKTNDTLGFAMTVNASAAPALASGGNSFADYGATATPDYNWSTLATDSRFGFSILPATIADAVANFKNNGTTCNIGAGVTANKCWLAFSGTTPVPVINRSSATAVGGEAEVVNFQAQSGASHFQPSGTYTATITATATAN